MKILILQNIFHSLAMGAAEQAGYSLLPSEVKLGG
jgi:hypothetical protein